MLNKLFNAIAKIHPALNMHVKDDFIVINEYDELLITEVRELLYNNTQLERISDVEWTVVEEFNYMAVCIV